MSGFGGFGTNPPGGGLFGAKPPEQGAGGFTIPTTTTTVTTSGLTFGTPTLGSGATGLFGTQQQQGSGFGAGFGTKTATTGTGFTFGASAAPTSTPAFGVPASTTTPAFGIPASTTAPAFGLPASTTAPAFGVPASTTARTFGVPISTNLPTFSASTSFGTPASTSAPPFGAPATSQSTFRSFGNTSGLTFGTASINATPSKPATGFTSNTLATPTINFNVTTSSTTTPLSFGIQTTSAGTTAAITTTSGTLSFGVSGIATSAATTQATGFSLSQPTTTAAAVTTAIAAAAVTTAITAAVATTTTAATIITTTTTSTSLTFGAPKTTGFTFGATTTTTPLGIGLFGTTKTVEASSSGTTTTTVTTVGLGGVDNKQTTQGLSGRGTLEPKQAKDNVLPDPIMQTLNEFQNFTKQQKSISVEISHGSSKPLKKVQEDTEAMESLLTTITSGLTRNAIAIDKLKTETAQGLHQAEMAQRNHETPPGLEYDNSAPSDYFNDLVAKFETDAVRLRVQVEASEKHLRSLMQSSTISPQELTLAMRRLHETLIMLAARVQALHTSVQSQKEQFKNLRRVYFKDDGNIFENGTDQNFMKKQTIYSMRSLTGPTPFSENPGAGPSLHVDGLAMLASSAGASIPATSTNPSWMSPLQNTANMPSLLPSANLLGAFQPLELPGFQLSKPPTGNKRSRR